MDLIKTLCPICGSDSQYCMADHDNIKYFRCSTCTDFQITLRGEDLIKDKSREWKQALSESAKESVYEQVLIIDMVDASKLVPGEAPYPVTYFCHRTKIQQCS